MAQHLVSFTLDGSPPTKANSRKIGRIPDHKVIVSDTGMVSVMGGTRTVVRKSDAALAYVEQAIIPDEAGLDYDGPVALMITVYYASNRSDLSIELIQDVLQTQYLTANGKRVKLNGQPVIARHGVYLNDRQVVAVYARKFKDATNPRAEITVYAVDADLRDHQTWLANLQGAIS